MSEELSEAKPGESTRDDGLLDLGPSVVQGVERATRRRAFARDILGLMETRGIVHGQRVELESSVPSLDGKRVRVRLDPLDDERVLSPVEQAEIWQQWVESGPQGPIEDDNDGWP